MSRAGAFVLGATVGVTATMLVRGKQSSPVGLPKVSPALDRTNEAFHRAYDESRADAETEAATVVLLADVVTLGRGASRTEHPLPPTRAHEIKSIAHIPVALFTLLHGVGGGAPPSKARRELRLLRTATREALKTLMRDEPGAHLSDAENVLRSSLLFIDSTLQRGLVPERDVLAFARRVGPLLTRLTDHATREQLSALHAAVEEALSPLGPQERHHLQVVVVGDHQARKRSLAVQYFQKRFGEPADEEIRVTYVEGASSVQDALGIVGRRRHDRKIADAFFEDARRLQQDVPGDAAARLLEQVHFDLL